MMCEREVVPVPEETVVDFPEVVKGRTERVRGLNVDVEWRRGD